MAKNSSMTGKQDGYVLLVSNGSALSTERPTFLAKRICRSMSIFVITCIMTGTTLWIIQNFSTTQNTASFSHLTNYFSLSNSSQRFIANKRVVSTQSNTESTTALPTAQPITTADVVARLMKDLRSVVSNRLNKAGQHLKSIPSKQSFYLSHGIIQGGLGNFMFMVGSTWGMAKTNNRTMVLLEKYSMEVLFESLGIGHMKRGDFMGNSSDQSSFGDVAAMKYTPKMENITAEKGARNVNLSGYLQSWKYFDRHRDDIRSLFTFSKSIFQKSLTKIEEQLKQYYLNLSIDHSGTIFINQTTRPTLIAIHVRRGDIVSNEGQVRFGHKPASTEYLLRASALVQKKYSSVVFLVISNDVPYCKAIFKDPNFLFMDNNREPAAVDMAIISLADHIILSVGTFGWWAAYLSDARDVYYYYDWPKKGSDMEKLINRGDYFYPAWTALKD